MSAATSQSRTLSDERRARLGRRAQLIAGASVAYNIIEAIVAISAGTIAGSVALVGFGLDSLVEVASGLVILWQFRHAIPQSRERAAQRAIAISFFALAAYVGVEAVRALASGEQPATSSVGIVIAALSLVIMPVLSLAQRATGRELGSRSVQADGMQTLLCTYLSAVLLIGLVINAATGWWWADPIAALVIAAVALREGVQTWRGDGCCAPSPPPAGGRGETQGAERGCATSCCQDG